MVKRCDGFGVKFSETDEICKQCEDAMECLKAFANDQFDMRDSQNGNGRKLPILNVLKPKVSPPVTVMIPKMMDDKIVFEIYFDKKWLKRQLFGEDEKKEG